MKFLGQTNIDFLGMRRYGFVISGAIILAGLLSLLLQGGPKLGIDFEGGTILQIRFNEDAKLPELRRILRNMGFEKSDVQTFGAPNEVLIRLKKSQDTETLVENLTSAILEELPRESPEFRRVETVGPKIGMELRGKALFTILTAMVGILIYISIRFEFKFAIGAITALVHDVIITLGIFSIMDYEISLAIVAAFLTIVGYSLNDTIVVFDRIRENIKRLKQESYNTIINRSINQSLSRTIITSMTTFVVVFTLYVAGGEVIKYFAFAMIIGVIVGTYSSIFIASPVLVLWHERFGEKQR